MFKAVNGQTSVPHKSCTTPSLILSAYFGGSLRDAHPVTNLPSVASLLLRSAQILAAVLTCLPAVIIVFYSKFTFFSSGPLSYCLFVVQSFLVLRVIPTLIACPRSGGVNATEDSSETELSVAQEVGS